MLEHGTFFVVAQSCIWYFAGTGAYGCRVKRNTHAEIWEQVAFKTIAHFYIASRDVSVSTVTPHHISVHCCCERSWFTSVRPHITLVYLSINEPGRKWKNANLIFVPGIKYEKYVFRSHRCAVESRGGNYTRCNTIKSSRTAHYIDVNEGNARTEANYFLNDIRYSHAVENMSQIFVYGKLLSERQNISDIRARSGDGRSTASPTNLAAKPKNVKFASSFVQDVCNRIMRDERMHKMSILTAMCNVHQVLERIFL